VVVVWGLLTATLSAAGLTDPRLQFRQFRTGHFVIYFHPGEERIAARLSLIAEDVRTRIAREFGLTPPALTHVVVADQSELANGWATPLPRDTVFLDAAVPSGAEPIGWTSDWLATVFAHEYTHIVHLDLSRSWARVVRAVFGRTPLAFPNLWLPQWQIEGLATYEESHLYPQYGGRSNAGEFRNFAIAPALASRPFPLDRVNGGLVEWPDGNAAYSAGMAFHEYLVTRMATDAVSFGPLAEATAARVPFTASRVFRRLFGASLGSMWDTYESGLATGHVSLPDLPTGVPRRVTRQGNVVSGPRFAPRSCDTCPLEIVYSSRTPHEFPSLRAIREDGTGDRVLTSRYLGDVAGISERFILFDQQELRRNVGVYSDLFVFDRRSRATVAVTHEGRVQDPDFGPDGASVVAVRENNGRRDVISGRLEISGRSVSVVDVHVVTGAADTQFSAPRWSPDGRLVAAERRRLGRLPDVVVIDPRRAAIVREISGAGTRIVTPAWRPDGRAVVAAADFGGRNWDLFEFPLESDSAVRQLTSGAGALWPEVSSDGRTLAFAGYTVDGYDVFTQAYAPVGVPDIALPTGASSPVETAASLPSSSLYSPLPTLAPTTWSPVIVADGVQTRVGAAVAGADLLARHVYSAEVSWLAGAPSDLAGGRPAGPDWAAAYAYQRWRPSYFLSASRQTLFTASIDRAGRRVDVALAERQLEAGFLLPFLHVRHAEQLFASVVRTQDQDANTSAAVPAVASARLAAEASTAKLFGYSISPDDGVTAGVTTEIARRSLGSPADATTSTADLRGYLPGFGRHHVIALRASAGIATGDAPVRQWFTLGGTRASSSVIDFGSGALGLLRGFPLDAFWGDRVAVANAEYRFPVAIVERGHGTLPVFLRTVHAAVFGDAGRTWDTGRETGGWKTAFGGELSADVVAGYTLPLSATAGAAWNRDGTTSHGVSIYFRLGRSF
jgi:hypothetical protein